MDLSFNKISRLPELLFRGSRYRRDRACCCFVSVCCSSFVWTTVAETTSLQDVDLSNNYLTSIPAALKGLATLKKLSLSANMIQVRLGPSIASTTSLGLFPFRSGVATPQGGVVLAFNGPNLHPNWGSWSRKGVVKDSQ